MLDFSLHGLQASLRNLLLEVAPSGQLSAGNAWHGRMTNAGNVIGYGFDICHLRKTRHLQHGSNETLAESESRCLPILGVMIHDARVRAILTKIYIANGPPMIPVKRGARQSLLALRLSRRYRRLVCFESLKDLVPNTILDRTDEKLTLLGRQWHLNDTSFHYVRTPCRGVIRTASSQGADE